MPNPQSLNPTGGRGAKREREYFVENLMVRIQYIIVMIGWTGLAQLEVEFTFPGSLASTFLVTHRFKHHLTPSTIAILWFGGREDGRRAGGLKGWCSVLRVSGL